MTKSDFREKWGPEWAALIASPMWQDALTTAESEIGLFKVASLPDEDLLKYGPLLLKGMQAHNKLELTLSTLADKPFEFVQLPEEYPDPVREARELANPPAQPKKPRKKKTP